jgi:hypothetical protein
VRSRILDTESFYVRQGGGILKFGGGVTDLSPPTTEASNYRTRSEKNKINGYSKPDIENFAM